MERDYPLEVKCPGDEASLRFAELVLVHNNITNYVFVDILLRPGVIFIKEGESVNLNDIIYGCQVFRINNMMNIRWAIFSKIMDLTDVGDSAATYPVAMNEIKSIKERTWEAKNEIVKDILNNYKIDTKLCQSTFSETAKFGEMPTHKLTILYTGYRTLPHQTFIKQIIKTIINGFIEKKDLLFLEVQHNWPILTDEQSTDLRKYISVMSGITDLQ